MGRIARATHEKPADVKAALASMVVALGGDDAAFDEMADVHLRLALDNYEQTGEGVVDYAARLIFGLDPDRLLDSTED